MPDVSRTHTLYEPEPLRRLPVRSAQQVTTSGSRRADQPLVLQGGHHILEPPITILADLRRIEWVKAGGDDDGAYIQVKGVSYDERLDLDLTLGGFEFEYVSRSAKLIHYSFRALIGSGEVDYIGHDRPIDDTLFDYHRESFFVAEPEVNLMLNVTKFSRIGVGASYRFISSVNLEGLTNSDLDGPSASLILKFGRF